MSADPGGSLKASEVYSRLRAAGYRLTAPRRALVDALLAAQAPLGAEELHARVHARVHDSGLNLSTVYRNLSKFVALGWVEAVPGVNGERRFGVRSAEPGAMTVVCLDCGHVNALPAEAGALCAAVAGLGFRADSVRVTLSAHCGSANGGSATDGHVGCANYPISCPESTPTPLES
jgi:Fur family ferric uptake transcriptional regulator